MPHEYHMDQEAQFNLHRGAQKDYFLLVRFVAPCWMRKAAL